MRLVRSLRLPLLMLPALAACDDGGGPIEPIEPLCDDMYTTPLGEVQYSQWPPDAETAHGLLGSMPARYTASDSCKEGGPTYVKVTGAVDWEYLPLVTQSYSEIGCGCTEDADFKTDSEYDHIAQVQGATVFLEDGFEAGAQNTTVFTDTALFGSGAPFMVRTCGSLQVQPYRGSAYDELKVVFRIDRGGVRTGTYTLSNSDETLECQLSNFVVEAVL